MSRGEESSNNHNYYTLHNSNNDNYILVVIITGWVFLSVSQHRSNSVLCQLCWCIRLEARPNLRPLFSTCDGSLLSSDGFSLWRSSFTFQLPVCTNCQLCFTSPRLYCFSVGFTASLPCQDGSIDRNTKQSLAPPCPSSAHHTMPHMGPM